MVFCTYCGHSFTRDEHLERHILTHTNVKPFKCFTCHMSFARRDLLQRHYTVHGRDQNQEPIPAANGMIPKSAGRTPIACSNCAKTKTKCDKKFPCSRCAGRNLRCTLRPTRRSSKNANRMGLITAETIANGVANGILPPEQTVAAEQAPLASGGNSPDQQRPIQIKPASPSHNIPPTIPEDRSTSDGPTHYYDQPTSSGPSPPPPRDLSPATPENAFVNVGFDEFAHAHKAGSEEPSPQFMLDWTQMQMPMGFDPTMRPDMMLGMDMGFDPMNGMPMNGDPMMTIMPDLANAGGAMITPIESPKVERAFSEMEIGGSASMYYSPHNGHVSIASMHNNHISDLGPIIAAQDSWNVFRCTPTVPSGACPQTAKINLERLEQTLRNQDMWSSWTPAWNDSDFAGGETLTVMQLHESTRDKLLAITQSFLHKALETHRGAIGGSPHHDNSPVSNGGSNFVLLPPARVLEYFLRSYANSFERYYPLTSRGVLDANELMHCYNDKASSLLILMMIAQGAMTIPSVEARWLTGGLLEACRISLFDLIERNIIMSGDPIVLRAALLFTEQAAWSGDKWQMDIAMGQRGMYSNMLRHSGALDSTNPPSGADHRGNPEQIWSEWIQHESRSRLIYSWAMVDQDLALFHDTAPLFSVTEFGVPMPDADRLWQARSSLEWSSTFEQVHAFSGGYSSIGSGARPLSLRDLFRHFLDDELSAMGIDMTALQMRLLLHPLQSMVCHYTQLISCFSETLTSGPRIQKPTVTAASTRCRIEEIQCLLQRWYYSAERYLKVNPMCAVMQANLVMFHLISLNAVTNFPEIERLARREGFDGTYQALVWHHKRCIADVPEAILHCGQVLRIIRSMPRNVRPPWWAGAVYRVALVLWTDSLIDSDSLSPPANGTYPTQGPVFAIDSLPVDHPLVVRYMTKREGKACLSKRDGSQVPMDHGVTVLGHCIEVLDEGASTRFSDGIRSKLDRLMMG